MTWCRAHQQFEPEDDLIDFPCSDTFLDAYYEQGLTPRRSPGYFSRPVKEGVREALEELFGGRREMIELVRSLQAELKALREENLALKEEILTLKKKVEKRKPKTTEV